MNTERRRFARQKFRNMEYVEVGPDNGGFLLDLSEGGAALQMAHPSPSDELIAMSFSLGVDSRVEVEGKIVWRDKGGKALGVSFLDLAGGSRQQIRAWLSKNESQPGVGWRVTDAATAAGHNVPSAAAEWRPNTPAPPSESAGNPKAPGAASVVLPEKGRLLHPPYASLDQIAPSMGHRARAAEPPPVEVDQLRELGLEGQSAHTKTEAEMATLPFQVPRNQFAFGAVCGSVAVLILLGIYLLVHSPNNVSGSAPNPADAAGSTANSPARQLPPNSSFVANGNAAPTAKPWTPAPRPSEALSPRPNFGNPASNLAIPQAASAPSAEDPGDAEYLAGLSALNGTEGPANSAQAAKHFWVAVGQKSVAAEVALAGLYLSGNGVRKSCDQARVLLKAAAEHGNNAASDMLEGMPAFGCH